MAKLMSALLLSAVLVGGCTSAAEESASPTPDPTGETIRSPVADPGTRLTREEAVREMVSLGCDAGFENFPELGDLPPTCETFILSVAPDGGIDPANYQQAMEEGLTEVAGRAIQYAWNETWVTWLAGASLVCDRTSGSPQTPSEREITLAALEVAVPGLFERVYEQAQLAFCPAPLTPQPAPVPTNDTTAQGAIDSLCSRPISQLPNLIGEGDSAYWTEVVQVLAVSEGIRVGPVDGQYGPQTIAGVRELQRRVGVVDDGQVGPITWTALQSYFC